MFLGTDIPPINPEPNSTTTSICQWTPTTLRGYGLFGVISVADTSSSLHRRSTILITDWTQNVGYSLAEWHPLWRGGLYAARCYRGINVLNLMTLSQWRLRM
jgi:hypothetical protein